MYRLIRNRFLLAFALFPATLCARPVIAADPAVDHAAILPYLDEGTFLVARLDVERVDQEALGKYMEESIDAMFKQLPVAANQRDAVKGQGKGGIGTAKTWLTDIAAAGGKHVYLLLETADLIERNDDPMVIIPLGDGADAGRIREVLSRNNRQPQNIHEIGKALVFAEPAAAERLKGRVAAAPLDRPDLARAFAATGTGDAPLRIVLVPGESARAWVEQNLPQLPAPLGGGDTKILSRGVRYASIGVVQKPATTANLTIRCDNTDKAKALFDVLSKGVESFKQMAPGGEAGEEAKKQADTIKPKLAGDTITVSVDPLAVQMAMMGVRMSARPGPNNGKAQPAEPAKKDDGGL